MKYQHTALKPDTEHSQSQHLGIRLAVEHMNDGIRKHEDYRTDSNRSKHSDGTAEYVAFPDTFQFEALFHTIYRYETVNYGLHLLLYPIQ